jgi:ElaB/YqjD/DUF883 family membrane-anchored ribosome-binding protein
MATDNIIDKKTYKTLLNLKKSLAATTDGAKSEASEMISDILEDIDSVKSEAQGYVEQYVKSYPIKSLGIATVVGLFIGRFIL